MAEFLELVNGAPNFNAMERGELVIHAYAMFAAGAKVDSENHKLRELVSLYHYGATHEASPSDVLAWSTKVDSLRRELGIEADE